MLMKLQLIDRISHLQSPGVKDIWLLLQICIYCEVRENCISFLMLVFCARNCRNLGGKKWSIRVFSPDYIILEYSPAKEF